MVKYKSLKKVHIHFYKGTERRTRMSSNLCRQKQKFQKIEIYVSTSVQIKLVPPT